MAPHQDYSSELSLAYRRGHPVANPQPGIGNDGHTLRPIDVGDVGYISHVHGNFIRMFNVHLEPGVDGQPELDDLPDEFDPLPKRHISLLHDKTPIFKSRSVSVRGISANASGPFLGGSVAFKAASERGAILATPDPIECYDAQHILSYKDHARAHIESWHEFAVQKLGLEIALEDVILVTGVDRTTSWATAVFKDAHLDTSFGLEVQYAGAGVRLASEFSWRHTQGALVNSGPTNYHRQSLVTAAGTGVLGVESSGPLNVVCDQSLFIRHIRAKRRRWLGLKLKANGEAEDDDDDDTDSGSGGELSIDNLSLVSSPKRPKFSDCLDPALDFILDHSDSDIAIAHNEDLALISNPATHVLEVSNRVGILRKSASSSAATQGAAHISVPSPPSQSQSVMPLSTRMPTTTLGPQTQQPQPPISYYPQQVEQYAVPPMIVPLLMPTSIVGSQTQQPQPTTSYYQQQAVQYAVPTMIVPSQMSGVAPGLQYGQPPNVPQHMLRHGYIAATFGTYGETAYCAFLKCGLGQIPLMFSAPGCTGAYTVAQSVLPHLPLGWRAEDGVPVVLLDRIIDQTRGPVILQEVWMPNSPRVYDQHVVRAVLRPPTFFVNKDGSAGLPLPQILSGNFAVNNADAPVDVGRSSIHLHIKVHGYTDRKRQFQTQESGQWIQLRRLVGHVGRAVDKYLREAEPDPEQPVPRMRIGEGGIVAAGVIVVGLVHVSSGSWMPILQLAQAHETT